MYGELDFSKFKPSGAFRVGYREFKTVDLLVECSIFYPAMDDGSGTLGVPYYTYGMQHILGLQRVTNIFAGAKAAATIPGLLKPVLGVTVPVYRNANVRNFKMQPIFFSHGLSVHRMAYSALYRELASCGYCVVSMTHGDGSADYSPVGGLFEEKLSMKDYWGRNLGVKRRE